MIKLDMKKQLKKWIDYMKGNNDNELKLIKKFYN